MLTADEKRAASEINARLGAAVEAIRGYTGITDRERKRMIADATITARDGLKAIRDNSAARTAQEHDTAFRVAFGMDPAHAAEERALRTSLAQEAPGPVEVAQRLAAAQAIGDYLACKVLGAYAWDRRGEPFGGDAYGRVVSAYADISPSVQAAVQALSDADAGMGDSGAARMGRLQDKLITEVAVPTEVSGGSLEGWAAEDTGPAQMSGMPFGIGGSQAS